MTTYAANPTASTLVGNTTLEAQFVALYSSSPTATQTTALDAAYSVLAAAVTSAGITQANINTINADFTAVLAAASSTSTATFPYFSLVLGEAGREGLNGFGGPGLGDCDGSGGSSSSNSTLTTAQQTLKTDIQTIEAASGTTVGELTTLHSAFQTLQADGLKPSSASALSTFEDSLVTTYAANPTASTLVGNTTLEAQFVALYSSSPTATQTTALDAAYSVLAAAVTSAGITQANINTINADFTAVLAAASSTSTATFPYFSLVLGESGYPGLGGFEGPGIGRGRH